MPMSSVGRAWRQEAEWQPVSERNRCPICDAAQGCHRDLEGAFVCCARRPSDWPLTNGEWLPRVDTAEGTSRLDSAERADGSVAAAVVRVTTLRYVPRS